MPIPLLIPTTAAAPLSMVRPYIKLYKPAMYNNIFNKYGSGNGRLKHRIYVPINGVAKKDTLEAPPAIQEFLHSKGMSVSDYKVGLATLPDGKRQVRIGKALSDNPMLLKMYNQDPSRSSTKSVPAWVVISRHPYDIVGMSFDRGWTSCMNAEEGSNRRYLKEDVKQGSIVCYLIKSNDKNINAPIARILLRPCMMKRHTILVPGPMYGTAAGNFSRIVDQFCTWANSGSPDGEYTLPMSLYNDLEGGRVVYHSISGKLPEEWKYRRLLAKNHNTRPEVLSQMVQVAFGNDALMELVAMNPNTSPEDLDKLSHHEAGHVQTQAWGNPSASAETLLNGLKVADPWDRSLIAENPSCPVDTLRQLVNDRDSRVRNGVAHNPSCPADLLLFLAGDKYPDIAEGVASHPNAPPEALTILAKSPWVLTRKRVAENTATPAAVLIRLAGDASSDVVRALADNACLPAEGFLAILNGDQNYEAQLAMVSNPKCPHSVLLQVAEFGDSDAQVIIATDSKNPELLEVLSKARVTSVVAAVAINPFTPTEVLVKLASHSSTEVRRSVRKNRNTPRNVAESLFRTQYKIPYNQIDL